MNRGTGHEDGVTGTGFSSGLVVGGLGCLLGDDDEERAATTEATGPGVGSTRSRCSPPTTPTTSRASRSCWTRSRDNLPELTPHHRVLAPRAHRGARPRPAVVRARPVRGSRGRPLRHAEGAAAARPGADRPGDAGAGLQGVPHPGGRLPVDLPHLRGVPHELRDVVEDHPGHLPIVVHLEVKDGVIPDPLNLGFVQPIPPPRDLHRRRGRRSSRCSTTSSWSRSPTCRSARHRPRRDRGRRLARRGRPPRPVRVRARRPRRQAGPVPDLYPDTLDRLIFVDANRPTTTPRSRCSTTRWPTALASASWWPGATWCGPAPTPTPSRRAAGDTARRACGLRQRRPDREHRLRAGGRALAHLPRGAAPAAESGATPSAASRPL